MTLLLFVLLTSATALAKNTYLNAFKARYGIEDAQKLNSCNTCHDPANLYDRNPYGADLEGANIKNNTAAAFAAVELLDSDNDGALNLTEIQNGTWPGDPSDTVATSPTTWSRIKALYR
jgi:hypothetical protein